MIRNKKSCSSLYNVCEKTNKINIFLSQAAQTFVRVDLKSTSPPLTTSLVCKIENSKTNRVEIAKRVISDHEKAIAAVVQVALVVVALGKI